MPGALAPHLSEHPVKFAILGAGVTGLTVARLLQEDGHDVTLFESSDAPGGLCRSSKVEGFTYDHAGGHILFSKNKKVLDWMLDRVGRDNLVQKDRNTRILWQDHRYVPYPFENGVGHLTPEAKFDCLKGYLESVDRRKSGEACPENFYDWIQWKMGSGFAEHFMVPYNEKIWECDLHEMASSWVAGRVPDAPVDDILKAAVGIDTQGYTHQAIFWFPLEGGFQALTDGIASTLHDSHSPRHARHECRAQAAKLGSVNDEAFDRVINTVPLPRDRPARSRSLPEWLREDIAKLRARSRSSTSCSA
jgi:protoporphyrinogen oxidase